MPFQITLQTFQAGRGIIDSFTAGPDQFTICSNFITLTAIVIGNLKGHTVEWEQLSGAIVALSTPNELSTSFNQLDGSTKSFRFYIDKGKPYEQFDDIFVYSRAVDNVITYASELQIKRGLDAPALNCNTFNFANSLIIPEVSYTFEGKGPSYLTPITVTWGEVTDPIKKPFIVGNDLLISYIPTPLIEFKGEVIEGVPRDTSIRNIKPIGTGPSFTNEPSIDGNALIFTGGNSCTIDSVFGDVTTHVTMSMWVKHTRTTTLMTLASLIDSDIFNLGDSRISLQLENGQVIINVENNGISDIYNSGALLIPDDGQYHHILVSIGPNVILYVDNMEFINDNSTVSTEFVFSKLVFGDISPNITSPFIGTVDNFRFYNTNLNLPIDRYSLFEEFTPNTMSASYFVDTYLTGDTREFSGGIPYSSVMFNDGAISVWLNNEIAGPLISDIFGSSDAVIVNNPQLADSKLIHNAGQSIKFNGINQYVQVVNEYPFIHNTGIFSIETWINIEDLDQAGTQNIMGTNSAVSGFGWNLKYVNTGLLKELIFTHNHNTQVSLISDVSTVGLESMHIIVTGDGSNINLYINGKFVSIQTISITSTGSACGFFSYGNTFDCITLDYPNTQFFNGNVSEVAVYNIELTPQTVLNHYRSSKYNLLAKYAINTRYSIAYTELQRLSCNVDFSGLVIENPVTLFVLDSPYYTYTSDIQQTLVRFSNIQKTNEDITNTNTVVTQKVLRYTNITINETDEVVNTYTAVSSQIERFISTSA